MLNHHQIREALANGDLSIDPDDSLDTRIQPASLDVRLGNVFGVFDRRAASIDPQQDCTWMMTRTEVPEGGYFPLLPDEFVLGATLERIGLSTTLIARIEGKSSLGRHGLLIHSTAGFIDPGWTSATITLELKNLSRMPIKLYPGMPIGQLALERVDDVGVGYSGKYVGQGAPEPSHYHLNWSGSRWI